MAKSNKLKLKIKTDENSYITKLEIEKDRPTHIKMNYSFITKNNSFSYESKKFEDIHKLALFDKIVYLSSKKLTEVLNLPKNNGIEFLEDSCFKKKLTIDSKFSETNYRKKELKGKFAVFRIYANNNPAPARVIGKLINNIFYIFYIDINHDIYPG